MRCCAVLLAGTSLLAISATWNTSQAAAYAYGTTQISMLSLRFTDNTPLPSPSTNQTVKDQSTWNGSPASAGGPNSGSGGVGLLLDINQATSGPGPFPVDNTFGQSLPGKGARSDAQITGGVAGQVAVNNVAEGLAAGSTSTPDIGSSQAGNTANIGFTVTAADLALHNTVTVKFDALWKLVAITGGGGDFATAGITNTFRISGPGYADSFAPAVLNDSVFAAGGTTDTRSGSASFVFTTLPLTTPGMYTIGFSSQVQIDVTGIPEPATGILLGAGLLGLGMLRRHRQAPVAAA
jgi:hypothetical protein